MTHEPFIELSAAELAKQAGFDWNCNHYYFTQIGKTELKSDFRHPAQNYNEQMATIDSKSFEFEACSCPTQSVLQKWLREVKGMSVEVCHVIVWVEGGTLGIKWCYRICYLNSNESDILPSDEFDTYEAALEAGLQKCLTLLIEKQ